MLCNKPLDARSGLRIIEPWPVTIKSIKPQFQQGEMVLIYPGSLYTVCEFILSSSFSGCTQPRLSPQMIQALRHLVQRSKSFQGKEKGFRGHFFSCCSKKKDVTHILNSQHPEVTLKEKPSYYTWRWMV